MKDIEKYLNMSFQHDFLSVKSLYLGLNPDNQLRPPRCREPPAAEKINLAPVNKNNLFQIVMFNTYGSQGLDSTIFAVQTLKLTMPLYLSGVRFLLEKYLKISAALT